MSLMTVAILVHQLGLAIGLGAAVCVEVISLGMLLRPINAAELRLVRQLARLVRAGYLMLCGSGLAFLAIYVATSPGQLDNPKLWTKLGIVAVLGLNSLAVHRVVLPHLDAQTGRTMFAGLPAREVNRLLFIGTLSAVSWLAAAVLGSVRELNDVVPIEPLIAAYLAAILLGYLAAQVVAAYAARTRTAGLPGPGLLAGRALGLAEAAAEFNPQPSPAHGQDRR